VHDIARGSDHIRAVSSAAALRMWIPKEANVWSGIFCTPFKLAAQLSAAPMGDLARVLNSYALSTGCPIITASDTQPPHLVLQGCSFESETLRSSAITSDLS
jgi:hypothetical protein